MPSPPVAWMLGTPSCHPGAAPGMLSPNPEDLPAAHPGSSSSPCPAQRGTLAAQGHTTERLIHLGFEPQPVTNDWEGCSHIQLWESRALLWLCLVLGLSHCPLGLSHLADHPVILGDSGAHAWGPYKARVPSP